VCVVYECSVCIGVVVKGVFVVYMCEWCVCMGVYSGV